MKSVVEGRLPFLPPRFREEEGEETDLLTSPVVLSPGTPGTPSQRVVCRRVVATPGTPVMDEGRGERLGKGGCSSSLAAVTCWPLLDVATQRRSPRPRSPIMAGIKPLDLAAPTVSQDPIVGGDWENITVEDVLLLDAPTFESLCIDHDMLELLNSAVEDEPPIQFAEPFPVTPGKNLERRVFLATTPRRSVVDQSLISCETPPFDDSCVFFPVTPGKDLINF